MKILITDDHVLFREGLKLLLLKLNPRAVVLEASNLAEALRVASQDDGINLVLFDLGLPGQRGIEALSQFKQAHSSLPTLVMSALEDQQTILDALSRGAMGFIPKAASFETLQDALKTVISNGIYLPPSVLQSRAASAHGAAPGQPVSKRLSELNLTHRQMQVFKLIMKGKSNKAIANDLCIAESTIKQHVKPILKALNVTSRVGAIVAFARLGVLLEPEVSRSDWH